MDLFSFQSEVLSSEIACVTILQDHGPPSTICPGKHGVPCGQAMTMIQQTHKSGRHSVRWRCTKKACRAERSVRATSRFLKYDKSDGTACGNLSLCEILHLLYLWLHTTSTLRQLRILTGRSLRSLAEWTSFFREACSHALVHMPKLVGSEQELVQIDESYFRGRRKYNRGRLLFGNTPEPTTDGTDEESTTGALPGPWVLGMCTTKSNVRFMVVPDRSADALLPLIQDHIEPGSCIWSDEWRDYNRLNSLGYTRSTVNRSEAFVDADTGANTQRIERAWKEGKLWLKRVRRPNHLMQSHLDELARRMSNADHPKDLLGTFLEAVAAHYTCPLE